jgi:ABC-2 type transport system ATP-binding protein
VNGVGELVELATSDAEATLRALLADRDALPGLEVRGATLEQAFLHLTTAPDGAAR